MYRTSEQNKFDQQEMIRYAADKAEGRGKLPFVKYLLENPDLNDGKIAFLTAVDVNQVRRIRTEMKVN